jgi:hypothetical protein
MDAQIVRQAEVMLIAAGGLRSCAAMLDQGDEIGAQLAHWATEMALAAQQRAGAPALTAIDGGR